MPDVGAPQLDLLLNTVHTLEPLIRGHADEAERNRRLSPVVVTALAEAGIFRMYTPRTLGGFEVEPLTFYRVVEAIARLDGSTGWCVFIAGGNPLLGAYLADEASEEVFGRDPRGITAGVVHPYGTAVVADGGYRVSGRWSYASGCQHSTWIFCCCNVFDGDQMRLAENGEPEARLFFIPIGQVGIVDTWDVSGLAGTGSHDVVIELAGGGDPLDGPPYDRAVSSPEGRRRRPTREGLPPPLLVACSLSGVEALVLVLYALVLLPSVDGDRVALGDGLITFEVESVHEDRVVSRVVTGGSVRGRPGVVFPSSRATAATTNSGKAGTGASSMIRQASWAASISSAARKPAWAAPVTPAAISPSRPWVDDGDRPKRRWTLTDIAEPPKALGVRR